MSILGYCPCGGSIDADAEYVCESEDFDGFWHAECYHRSRIRAVPKTYRGSRFRSTLEADWAATLDQLGIVWQYEPEAVRLPSGQLYRPDFYLPRIATWLEAKGPHDERIEKTRELAEAVMHHPGCCCARHGQVLPGDECETCGRCWWSPYQVVVVGRAPVYGLADWTLLDPDGDGEGRLYRCPRCRQWWWPTSGAYGCRSCRRGGSGNDDLGGESYRPGSVAAAPGEPPGLLWRRAR